MFYAPNKVDSKGRWGKMLSPEDWEVYKASQEFKELFPDGIPEEITKRHEKENSLRLKIRRTDAST